MDTFLNFLGLILIGILSFGCGFVFFAHYSPKEPDAMPQFIAREKGKCLIGLVVCTAVTIYYYFNGKNIWEPLLGLAFTIGMFASVKYQEKHDK